MESKVRKIWGVRDSKGFQQNTFLTASGTTTISEECGIGLNNAFDFRPIAGTMSLKVLPN
jgi:hypothetical protein